jgi:sugar phosphate isomerase/epimerase
VRPGHGANEFGPILEALRWDGFYDLEIFSDAELEGSLWCEDPRKLAARGIDALRRTASSASV